MSNTDTNPDTDGNADEHPHAEWLEDEMVVAPCSTRASGDLIVHVPGGDEDNRPACGTNRHDTWRRFGREWVTSQDWRVCAYCRGERPAPSEPDRSTLEKARAIDPDDLPPLDDQDTTDDVADAKRFREYDSIAMADRERKRGDSR